MSEEIFGQKKVIRHQIRELKNGLTPSQKQLEADTVFYKIELLPEFQNANNIFIYWSLPDELPTLAFIGKWCDKKQFFLPAIVGNVMVLKHYSLSESLLKGSHGIMEPNSLIDFNGEVELGIIPGIAFDGHKNRLGRGKGYYDRFFSNNKSLKIGVCFDFQLLKTLPVSLHDVKMDKIVSPTQIVN